MVQATTCGHCVQAVTDEVGAWSARATVAVAVTRPATLLA